jgi:hypothetical protein
VAIIKNNRVFAIAPDTNEGDDQGCDHQHIRFMKHTSKAKSIGSGVAKTQTVGGDSIHHHTSLKRHH